MEPGSTEGGRAGAGKQDPYRNRWNGAVDWAYEEGKKQGFLKEKKENMMPETSLFETLKTTAGLRNCEPEALAEAVYANFYRFISVHMVVWRSDKLLKTGLVN